MAEQASGKEQVTIAPAGDAPVDDLVIVTARPVDAGVVSEILTEAAEWLIANGQKLWERDELDADAIRDDVASGMYRLAYSRGVPAGCCRFQTEDREYWDDVPHEDSAFIHRVAVRRQFAGQGISSAMIENAKLEALRLGKRFLRLDCADRPRLREVYERQGFRFHSYKERVPYKVARYQFELSRVDQEQAGVDKGC